MQYKDLPQFSKPYVLQRMEGYGVMESPSVEKEYVKDFDTEEELIKFGDLEYPRDKSGWTFNNYQIVVNTSTEKGRELFKDFERVFKLIEEKIRNNPERYKTYVIDGNKVTIEHNEAFDDKIKEKEV